MLERGDCGFWLPDTEVPTQMIQQIPYFLFLYPLELQNTTKIPCITDQLSSETHSYEF